MKPRFSTLLIYSLMGLLTFGYTCTIRLGLGIFNILYDPANLGQLSDFSTVTASMSMIDVWQYFAWGSFIACLIWGVIRQKHGASPEPHVIPWICHLTIILASFFLNTVGALSPFISPAYVIQ